MIKNFALIAAMGAAFAIGVAAAQPAQLGKAMPVELRGNWYEADNYAAPVCSDDDIGLLQVESDGFTFPLEVGRLIDIVEHPIDTYRVRFYEQVITDGPDLPRANKRTQTWTLSHDGEQLNIVAKGMTLDLLRCRPQAGE
jgi:hypothetical protein